MTLAQMRLFERAITRKTKREMLSALTVASFPHYEKNEDRKALIRKLEQ